MSFLDAILTTKIYHHLNVWVVGGPPVTIGHISPDKIAARHAVLRPGLVIVGSQGESVSDLPLHDIIARIKSAARCEPRTLSLALIVGYLFLHV